MVSGNVKIRLKSRRLAAEIARRRGSQNAWARRLGVSPAYLSQLLNGKRRYPGDDVRRALLERLELEFDDLFELESPGPTRTRLSLGLGRWSLRVEERPTTIPGVDEERASMETIVQDLRYALRILRRQPLLTTVAILTLALGIGANTTIFTLVNGLLLDPLALPDADRLVAIYGTDSRNTATTGRDWFPISLPNFRDLREQSSTFSDMAATAFFQVAVADGAAEPQNEPGQLVSASYFDVLGIEALVGRTFLPSEEGPEGAHPVAVISHALWQERYGGDPAAVGEDLRLNGHPFTIVGVAPPGFRGQNALFATEVWVPVAMHPQVYGLSAIVEARRWRVFQPLGRLRAGVTVEQAAADLAAIAARLAAEYPDDNLERGTRLLPLEQAAIDPNQRGLFVRVSAMLFAVVGLVLAITCANVANLTLARAATRSREIAVRLSLGAARRRVVRQLLSESLLMSLAGGALAIVVAMLGRDLLWAHRPPFLGNGLGADLDLDWRVLGFTFATAAFTGLLFGLAPALRATRTDLSRSLQARAPGDGGASAARLRSALVVAQVALSFIAVAGAGLFLSSLRQAQGIDPGFDVERLLTAPVNVDSVGYEPARGLAFFDELRERVEAQPGVESAALASNPPLVITFLSRTTIRDGDPDDAAVLIGTNSVSPGYFRTMGLRILSGRDFDADDNAAGRPVIVANRVMAERFWPDRDAVGQRVRFQGEDTRFEVVGVVEDMKYNTLGEEPQPYFYQPLPQRYGGAPGLLVRTGGGPAGEPTGVVAAIRGLLREMEPELPVPDIAPASDALDQSLWAPRMAASLLSLFGFLSLTLATVGIYGLLAQIVAQRRREIGIRMALGAARADVQRLVVLQTLRWVLAGGAVGLLATLLGSRWVEALLYGTASDPVSYGLTAVVLCAAGLIAASLPAYRAARVDPAVALRDD